MHADLKLAIFRKFGPGRQWQAARRADISESTLSRIIVGHRTPTAKERRALSRALRMPQRDLFPEQQEGEQHADCSGC